jgi:outer membrane protein assembly factor BamB/PKD repeat protein
MQSSVWRQGLVAILGCGVAAAGLAADTPRLPPVALPSTATVKSYTPSPVPLPVGKPENPARDDRQLLRYTLVTPPAHGTVQLPAPHPRRGQPANAIYTPARDFTGEDAFAWRVSDGAADSGTARAVVTVAAAIPQAEAQIAGVAAGASAAFPATFVGGGGYTYAIVAGSPAHGALTVNGTTFRYTPQPAYTGADGFTWSMTYQNGAAAYSTRTATCWLVVKPAADTDWPQWRADEWRSGFTAMRLPETLRLRWRRELPAASATPFRARGTQFADIDACRPVQLGRMLFVPVTASDALLAFDTETGAERWRFYASGVVRRPPAAVALPGGTNLVILGSDDGWVYALDAADGAVHWRFRGAPNHRKAIGFGRLSSVWPIWASPVVRQGRVYFAAGYLHLAGLYAYCLDAASGRVVWVNDGRILDMWNTSALGPLAFAFDGTKIYGSVEGACRPWMVEPATGAFLGHLGVGTEYPGVYRNGSNGWFVDGKGTFVLPGRTELNEADPVSITAGTQTYTPADAAALGVTGTVTCLLAGDGKLFATTAEGGLYCFDGTAGPGTVHACATNALPAVADGWTAAAAAMLGRPDLRQGLALVCGLGSGRLAEELVKQSSLQVVVIDPDRARLQAFRARMDAAGLSGARASTLEGRPLDFGFAPCQAALIVSEEPAAAGLLDGPQTLAALYRWTRPMGGEVWLATTAAQDAALARAAAGATNLPLCAWARTNVAGAAAEGFTQLRRLGVPPEMTRLEPPLGVAAFGTQPGIPIYLPLVPTWQGLDPYSWLPLKAALPGSVPPLPAYTLRTPGYPTAETITTPDSIFGTLWNPLYGVRERFAGLPASGADQACGVLSYRYGDYGLTHGKIASFFDASAGYWGRMFLCGLGACPGRMAMGHGFLVASGGPVSGNTCGCAAGMQFSDVMLMPMPDDEENWVAFQAARTGADVEELPIRTVGVNFGAPGDRLMRERGLLWTHSPYAGLYGQCSRATPATPESLPLVPVTFRGAVAAIYHHSAQMEPSAGGGCNWVAASAVQGMSEITLTLAQPAVALRSAVPPKLDGLLDDACWDGARSLQVVPNPPALDPKRTFYYPRPADECRVMFRHDDENLYVGAEVRAACGPRLRRHLTVTLNSRERVVPDLVVTCEEPGRKAGVREATPWRFALGATKAAPFSAEVAIPWKALADAGLWKEQLIVNVNVCGCPLTARYTPLSFDAPFGPMTAPRASTVRLHFAEMEGRRPGERVFDVSLQGRRVLEKFDVAKEAGGPRRALVRVFPGVPVGETLRIGFAPVAGEPLLGGVEIVAEDAGGARPAHPPPTARIEASTFAGPAPLAMTFSARGSTATDAQIAACAWRTGDGRLAQGSVLRHVYAEPGTYRVMLQVRDSDGGTANTNLLVTVTAGVPAAFVCTIGATGADYPTLAAWEAALRSDLTAETASRLLAVKGRGTYAAADDGRGVTFAGGGTGTLRHINAAGVAFVTDCRGAIQAGPVTCASGNTFEIADGGHPVWGIVAELGAAAPAAGGVMAGAGWQTDPLHSVTLRGGAAPGPATLPGDLDLTALRGARVSRVSVGASARLALGAFASASDVQAGTLTLQEGGCADGCRGGTFAATGAASVTNRHVSYWNLNRRDGARYPVDSSNAVPAAITFLRCTAGTFDAANQPRVAFIDCTAAPGEKGFGESRDADPPLLLRCPPAGEDRDVSAGGSRQR